MNAPEHTQTAGSHVLSWQEFGLQVKVDRMREDRGGLSGEILVQVVRDDGPRHIHVSKLNLLSASGRKAVIDACQKRINHDELDWGAVIEAACIKVIAAYRESEPVEVLQEIDPLNTGDEWLLMPLLKRDQANLVAADGGTGKSYVALLMASLVATGKSAIGWNPQSGNVLYLDYETDAVTQARRLDRIRRGMNLPELPSLFYRYCTHALSREIEDLERIVVENAISLVVVDSLGSAVDGDLRDAAPILEYARALRALRCTTLTVHHLNKSDGFYGSAYVRNFTRTMWTLERHQEPGDGTLTVGFSHVKANDDALFKPFAVQLAWDKIADTVSFQETGYADVPSFAANLPIWQQAAHYLKSHSTATPQDIATAIGKEPEVVRREMERKSGHGSGRGSGHIFQKVSGSGLSATDGLLVN